MIGDFDVLHNNLITILYTADIKIILLKQILNCFYQNENHTVYYGWPDIKINVHKLIKVLF